MAKRSSSRSSRTVEPQAGHRRVMLALAAWWSAGQGGHGPRGCEIVHTWDVREAGHTVIAPTPWHASCSSGGSDLPATCGPRDAAGGPGCIAMACELWHTESDSLIAAFDTREAALAAVRNVVGRFGRHYLNGVELLDEERPGRLCVVAVGAELAALAAPVPA
jgi:hypothetical protein